MCSVLLVFVAHFLKAGAPVSPGRFTCSLQSKGPRVSRQIYLKVDPFFLADLIAYQSQGGLGFRGISGKPLFYRMI